MDRVRECRTLSGASAMISGLEYHLRNGHRIIYSHQQADPVHGRIKRALRNAGVEPEEWLVNLLTKCDVLVEAARSMKLFVRRIGNQIDLYLGDPSREPHGHVIVCEKWKAIYYARGYQERRGMENCCCITL